MLFLKRCSDVFEAALRADRRGEAREGPAAQDEAEKRADSAGATTPTRSSSPSAPAGRTSATSSTTTSATGSTRRSPRWRRTNTSLEGVLAPHRLQPDGRQVHRSPTRSCRDLIKHFSKYRLRNEDFEFPDLLGAAYEYLIRDFADSAGKKGGEFYTPRVGRPHDGPARRAGGGDAIYDPCSGSGGMLILSQGVRRRARRQLAEPRPLRPGVQRRRLVDLAR